VSVKSPVMRANAGMAKQTKKPQFAQP